MILKSLIFPKLNCSLYLMLYKNAHKILKQLNNIHKKDINDYTVLFSISKLIQKCFPWPNKTQKIALIFSEHLSVTNSLSIFGKKWKFAPEIYHNPVLMLCSSYSIILKLHVTKMSSDLLDLIDYFLKFKELSIFILKWIYIQRRIAKRWHSRTAKLN